VLLALLLGPVGFWFWRGEEFLSPHERVINGVLVVEGWIGKEGILAAAKEFKTGDYQLLVTAGTKSEDRWGNHPWDFAQLATNELVRAGIPKDKIVTVSVEGGGGRHRTYRSAHASFERLQAERVTPPHVTVMTLGCHGRRSWLVYSRVFQGWDVGVLSVQFADYQGKKWWESSERARSFVIETLGFPYEWMFHSGRKSDSA